MRFNISCKLYAALYAGTLVTLSNIHEASARLATSSDIREQVMKKSEDFIKVEGEEQCIEESEECESDEECCGDLYCWSPSSYEDNACYPCYRGEGKCESFKAEWSWWRMFLCRIF